MKTIVTLLLATLLISPGILSAAEQKPSQASAAPRTTTEASQRLDLNRATTEELVEIPGIGQRTAEAIIELRSQKGSFSSVEDLLEVRGIKEKKLATISAYLTVTPLLSPATAAAGTSTR